MKRRRPIDLVAAALLEPASVQRFEATDWDLLVRQARAAELLARIAALLEQHGLLEGVPHGPREALASALALANAQHDEARREVAHVRAALASLDVRIVLLKGAAYVFSGVPAARGRTLSDLDVLVPRDRLAEVESALLLAGWATTHPSKYDQHYYRTWMHELPPLQHVRRQTMLDVHHAILPATARLKPDSGKLLSAAVPVGSSGIHVLAPHDMVLHSLTHLFQNEELSHGLRDLSDVDLLLRHFGAASGFWEHLLERARELGLVRPLYYGLHQVHRILRTPVPLETLQATGQLGPRWPLRAVMDGLWSRALRPLHPSTTEPLTGTTLLLLYARAHWQRMPPALLARHLLIKAVARAE